MRVWLICALASVTFGAAGGTEPESLKQWDFHVPHDARAWGWRDLHDAEYLGDTDVLRLKITGIDTFVASPPLDLPLDGILVRIQLRSDCAGDTQLYWRTSGAAQFSESAVQSKHTSATPAGAFQTIEFEIGRPEEAGQRLAQIRLDPFNGNAEGTVEIRSIEILRLPPLLDARFSCAVTWVDVSESISPQVCIRQIGGRKASEPYMVSVFGGSGEQNLRAQPVFPTTQPVKLGEVRFKQAGVHFLASTIISSQNQPLLSGVTSVIVGKHERLPLIPALRSARTRLDFVRAASGGNQAVGAARWSIRDRAGEWRECGWLTPLFSVSEGPTQEGSVNQWTFSCEVGDQTEQVADLECRQDRYTIRLRFVLIDTSPLETIRVTAELMTRSPALLAAFSGPTLRCTREASRDPLDRFALLGGIEFLEPGWRSSGERGMGKWFRDRWSLWPFKIAMPVTAVEASGITTAMMWDPEQEWALNQSMPAVTFASPNFLDNQLNHLMELSVPGTKEYRLENSSCAQKPYRFRASTKVTLRYTLYAEPDLPVAKISKRYYELFPPAPLPPQPHDDRVTYNQIARNIGETMYTAGKGWTMHWFFPEQPRHIPMAAAELISHAIETGDKRWIDATGQTGRGIVEAAGSLVGQFAIEGAAKAALHAMRPDGSFAFRNTGRMRQQAREFTKGLYDSLGEDGSTSLGTCVQSALPLLRYALVSGDEKYVPGCIQVLEAMRGFRVPRGAQVWEVHQEIPDIRAAALAVEAYQLGYRLTGDEQYLDDASYWAWAGVPFVYSWHVPLEDEVAGELMSSRDRTKSALTSIPLADCFENPRRRVTPYATIPVLGPTFYVINWFGVPVQWCGLEWGWKVLELLADRPDPLLKAIADGVVASGLQQTFDRPPWVGLYPDSWDLQHNRAQGSLLSSHLPLQCLQSQGRVPVWTRSWTRILRGGAGKPVWHVSGWGPVPELKPPLTQPLRWSVELRYPAGELNELLIAGAKKPRHVRIEDEFLNELEATGEGLSPGWYYDAARRLIVARFRQPQPVGVLRVSW